MPKAAKGMKYRRDNDGAPFPDMNSRGLYDQAKQMVIPPGARLVWSDEENKMVWRVPSEGV